MPIWTLAITDFAIPAPRLGHIDFYTGLGNVSARAQRVHQEIQQQNKLKFTHYSAEVAIEQIIPAGKDYFKLCGKIDSLWSGANPKIEEIKTAVDAAALLQALENNYFNHPYWLQLQTYGYLYWLKDNIMPALSLLVVCLRTNQQWQLPLEWDLAGYENWLVRRTTELTLDASLYKTNAERRKQLAPAVIFPYLKKRPAQQQLLKLIKDDIKNKKPALIQAPTGMGKTLGVLFPLLKESLKRGQRTVYVVPKNSQQAIAADAVKQLETHGSTIHTLELTAKSKLCLNTQIICHSNHCTYAKNHHTKVVENQLIIKANKQNHLDKAYFIDQAQQFEVCPYTLQMDAMATRDVIIADYNYVFSPGIASDALVGNHFSSRAKANLIIDEAHNLLSRSLDMYTARLSAKQLQDFKLHPSIPKKLAKQFNTAIKQCCAVIEQCAPERPQMLAHIELPAAKFIQQDESLNQLLTEFLTSELPLAQGEPWFQLIRLWSDFVNKIEQMTDNPGVFFTVYQKTDASITIICTDASLFLAKQYAPFKHIMAFSATLKPFNYYQHFFGLPATCSTHELASPFNLAKRKLLIIPQLSTKYKDRSREYSRMIEVVERITALKLGNYLLFFPSFSFLEAVLALFPSSDFKILQQTPNMKREAVEALLNALRSSSTHHLVFAVQGGIFSEGLDYVGKLAIGAFIFGPPLPVMDGMRTIMHQFYSKNYPEGHAYSTIYPAMAKSIQAAGRVIRTEHDKGIIVLLDNRFLLPLYQQCMPEDWFVENARECVSTSIINDVREFWEST